MEELKRLQHILNENLVANKRIHIECEQLIKAIETQLKNNG